MTRVKKEAELIVYSLLRPGYYLRLSITLKGERAYKLYNGNQNPLRYFTYKAFEKISHLTKEDGKKRITISRKELRSLDGRSAYKKVYKKSFKNIYIPPGLLAKVDL